ncbi:MAG: hypothetical protein M3N13_10620 [Candidatus Eremiobacteraeota bacterium]|nr:hypothetical protein [Candidatus Eremiobacteraeota bacterium]
MKVQLKGVGISIWNPPNIAPPPEWVQTAKSALQRAREKSGLKAAQLTTLDQIAKLIECFEKLSCGDCAEPALLETAFGKKSWRTVVQQIISNHHSRPDTYFFPPNQGREPVLSEPSVALLRYPVSYSLALFDIATDVTIRNWGAALESISRSISVAGVIAATRPLKVARVSKITMADLVHRFATLYTRVGASDLPELRAEQYLSKYVTI